ncbi:MAG: hypothetical protein AAB568_01685 [Patescibacteria group bacterium]
MFNPLDQTAHPISHEELKKLISHFRINTLDDSQCADIRATLESARSDGKISQYKIHRLLKNLRAAGKINTYDQSAIENAFGDFFGV